MSRRVSISLVDTVKNQRVSSAYYHVKRNFLFWIRTKPQPYVDKASGFTGIKTLNSIEDLCHESRGTINKYLTYFSRICITRRFINNSQHDIIIMGMDDNGRYKVPSWYVLFVCYIFCLFIYACKYIYV